MNFNLSVEDWSLVLKCMTVTSLPAFNEIEKARVIKDALQFRVERAAKEKKKKRAAIPA